MNNIKILLITKLAKNSNINNTDLLVDLQVKMRFGGDEIGGDSRFFDFLGSKSKFLLV